MLFFLLLPVLWLLCRAWCSVIWWVTFFVLFTSYRNINNISYVCLNLWCFVTFKELMFDNENMILFKFICFCNIFCDNLSLHLRQKLISEQFACYVTFKTFTQFRTNVIVLGFSIDKVLGNFRAYLIINLYTLYCIIDHCMNVFWEFCILRVFLRILLV